MSLSPSGSTNIKLPHKLTHQQSHQHNLSIPLVGKDYGGYPSVKNSNIEKTLDYFDHQKDSLHHIYDENIELFPMKSP